MRVSSLLIVVAAQLLSTASVAGARVGEISRQLQNSRAEDVIASSGLECTVSTTHAPSESEGTFFEYWYAMGTRGPVDPDELNIIETKIFNQAMLGMVWCTSVKPEDRAGDSTRHLAETARDLGIIAVNSGSADIQTKFSCSFQEQLLVELTGSLDCTVVKGLMRILHHKVDNVDYVIASLRDTIEASMEDTSFYTGSDTPNVVFLSYLGDASDEAINDGGDGNITLWEGDFSDFGIDSDSDSAEDEDTFIDGGVIIAGLEPQDIGEDDDSGLALIVGVTVPLVVGLILAALFMQRKREVMTEDGYRDMMNSEFVLVGTGDPPSSFHEGLYHYMRDGTRYLSTRCEGCLETRKNSFYTDNNLGTIMEDEEFEDVTGLGAKPPTMNVHKCGSAVCNRCTTAPGNQTCFVAASGNSKVIILEDEYNEGDSQSLITDIHSTGASPRASDHIEV